MLVAPRRIPRCALTGAPIMPGDIVKRVAAPPGHRAKPGYLERADDARLVSAPITLHRSQQDGAVGLAYAVMMASYLELAVAEQKAALSFAEREALIAWWDSPYGVSRVRRGLVARLRETLAEADAEHTADETMAIVVSFHQAKGDPDTWATHYGHDGPWLRDRVAVCMKIANRRGRVATA